MSVFERTEKMYEVLGELWESVLGDPELGKKFKAAQLTIKFDITEPTGQIWLTPEGKVICGTADLKPTIEMRLNGDSCHLFWLKKLKLPVALATGKIKSKGPIPKILKLLPMLGPVYERYPQIAQKHGLQI